MSLPTVELVGVIAVDDDRDVAARLVEGLTSESRQCVADPEAIERAPVVIVVCSRRAIPDGATVGRVDRAFGRGARLLPLLIDTDSAPEEIAHFVSGVRPLVCAREQLADAVDTLRRALDRHRARAVRAAPPPEPVPPAPRPVAPMTLNAWSRVVRAAAIICVAGGVVRVVDDWSTLGSLAAGEAAFTPWLERWERVVTLQGPLVAIIAIGFLGWLRAAYRALVLVNKERTAYSWWALWRGYIAALVYPPIAVRSVARVWAAVAGEAGAGYTRIAVVSIWWMGLLTAMAAPLVVQLQTGITTMNLAAAIAAAPRPPATQVMVVSLILLSNAAWTITLALSAIIARERRAPSLADRDENAPVSGSARIAVLVAMARRDRIVFNTLALQLRARGIDTYASYHGAAADLTTYDALLVFSGQMSQLPASDLEVLAVALTGGRPAIIPVSWRSQTPPPELHARLGTRNWFVATADPHSVHALATVLRKHVGHRAPNGVVGADALGMTSWPTRRSLKVVNALFALASSWGLLVLCRSLANLDLQAFALIAVGRGLEPLANPQMLAAILRFDLISTAKGLLPAAAALLALSWLLARMHRARMAIGGDEAGDWYAALRPDSAHRPLEWLAALIVFAFAAVTFQAPLFALLAHTGWTIGLAAAVFAAVGATAERLREVRSVWEGAGPPDIANPTRRRWVAPLLFMPALLFIVVVGVGLWFELSMLVQAALEHPQEAEPVRVATAKARSTITDMLAIVHLPLTAIWFWWLNRLTRDAREVGNDAVERRDVLWAMVPLAGHAALPHLLRTVTRHQYPADTRVARLTGVLTTVTAFCLAVSQFGLLQVGLNPTDPSAVLRAAWLSTCAVIIAVGCSIPVFWVTGLYRVARRGAEPQPTGMTASTRVPFPGADAIVSRPRT